MTASPRIIYSEVETTWLSENRHLPKLEYHRQFVAAFGRDVTADNLKNKRKREGWKTGRNSTRTNFTAAELSWLSENRHLSAKDCCEQFNHIFARNVPVRTVKDARKSRGWKNGRVTTFSKDYNPHKKRATGQEVIYKYTKIKVDEGNPLSHRKGYVDKHRLLWVEKNGSIPPGMALKCLTSDRANADPSNWELIPFGLLSHLNRTIAGQRYEEAPAELKPTIMAIARLRHQIRSSTARETRTFVERAAIRDDP